jgi:peptidoglycan/LPS O-acetylase OafA/YrhL
MTNLPQTRRREPGLDLLRAAAIVTVMLYHVASHGFPLPGIGHHGWIGVDLFFVLSGYLIGWQVFKVDGHGGAPAWGGFMIGRALRVLPAAVLYVGVERPALRLRDRLLARRAASATPGGCTAGPVPCVTLDESTLPGRE